VPWLSITLELETAQAEAYSDALIEAGADSVDLEPGVPRVRITALAASGSNPRALLDSAAQSAGIATPGWFEAHEIGDEDWVLRSRAQFASVQAGTRLWIVPSWHTPPAPPAIVVRLDPGLAFGTGSHPSTWLVLSRLEAIVRGGERVLDWGCGSGILAIAAAKLGAGAIDGVDIDQQALEVAAANARLNGVTLRTAQPEQLPPGAYDLVLANILAGPIIDFAPQLAARTVKGGRILLCGILEEQAAEVIAAYRPYFDSAIAAREEDWVLIEGERR
jgi:ribosomal protein L11 methyltransferase